jgi:polyisoprenoid-binding protein YceI
MSPDDVFTLKERIVATWFFEPGHTAAEFCVRHMMVTFVRGHFKDIHGTLVFDPANPVATSVEATIEASGIWTGEAGRDTHLKSEDFLDVEKFPTITFAARHVELAGANEAVLRGELTIRGITRTVPLRVHYLGQWPTPWWEDGVDKGPKIRAGFAATTTINRHDFGVSWNSTLDRGGVVVGNMVEITIDAEAILHTTAVSGLRFDLLCLSDALGNSTTLAFLFINAGKQGGRSRRHARRRLFGICIPASVCIEGV